MTKTINKTIPLNEMAYMKMSSVMTTEQRIHWNKIKSEMWYHADYLLDRATFNGDYDRSNRLKNLIGQLPTFDLDGNGFCRTGNAIEDF